MHISCANMRIGANMGCIFPSSCTGVPTHATHVCTLPPLTDVFENVHIRSLRHAAEDNFVGTGDIGTWRVALESAELGEQNGMGECVFPASLAVLACLLGLTSSAFSEGR